MHINSTLHLCYGEAKLSEARIYHWIKEFQGGRTTVVDLQRPPKRKTGHSRANIRAMENVVAADRRVTIHRLAGQTGLKYSTVQAILTKDLKLRKKCAKYVPYSLTPVHIQRHFDICNFWNQLIAHTPHILQHIVTMDESWVYLYDPETKEQSKEWLRSCENRPQKARRTIGTGKVMAVTFFDSKGLIYLEFV